MDTSNLTFALNSPRLRRGYTTGYTPMGDFESSFDEYSANVDSKVMRQVSLSGRRRVEPTMSTDQLPNYTQHQQVSLSLARKISL
jgi:hypothetical protein